MLMVPVLVRIRPCKIYQWNPLGRGVNTWTRLSHFVYISVTCTGHSIHATDDAYICRSPLLLSSPLYAHVPSQTFKRRHAEAHTHTHMVIYTCRYGWAEHWMLIYEHRDCLRWKFEMRKKKVEILIRRILWPLSPADDNSTKKKRIAHSHGHIDMYLSEFSRMCVSNRPRSKHELLIR